MTTKRARVVRSSSSGEVGLLKPVDSPVALLVKKRATGVAPVNHSKPTEKENSKVRITVPEQPRQNIFTLGSPVREENDNGFQKRVDERSRVFFQNCFHCRKKIPEDKDMFMYGYLQAFCSPKCRDIQIDLDEKSRKSSEELTAAAAATKVKEEPAKRVVGSHVNKYTIAKFK